LHLKNVISPGWHVEIQTMLSQVISLSVIYSAAQHVLQGPCLSRKIIPWQTYITLTLVICVVYDHESVQVLRSAPGEGYKCIIAVITIPGWPGIEEAPASITECRIMQAIEESPVEREKRRIDAFQRPTPERSGDSHPLAFAVPGGRTARGGGRWITSGSAMDFRANVAAARGSS
jgi:hypothetical protein